jgi:acetyl esterase/lipase
MSSTVDSTPPTTARAATPARTRPAVDPSLAGALAAVAAHAPSMTPDLIPAARQISAAFAPDDEGLRRAGRIGVEQRQVPGPEGAPDITLLVCRPTQLSAPAAGIYFIHGGGMVSGSNRTGLDVVLDWVEEFGMVAVSVEYRLAPEHPHPAPVEDCYAGLLWTAAHAADLGIEPHRLLLAGGSAGGGLAAAVALMARDQAGPALLGMLLMAPMLDDRAGTPSSRELVGEGLFDSISNLTGWSALLGDARGGPDVSPYAAPARANDLSGLPPAFIDVGSVETFRDEDITFAARIWQAGGSAELHVWSGGFHGFELIAPDAPVSRAARAARASWLTRILGASG